MWLETANSVPLRCSFLLKKATIETRAVQKWLLNFGKEKQHKVLKKLTETTKKTEQKQNFWTALIETPKIGSKSHSKLMFTKDRYQNRWTTRRCGCLLESLVRKCASASVRGIFISWNHVHFPGWFRWHL